MRRATKTLPAREETECLILREVAMIHGAPAVVFDHCSIPAEYESRGLAVATISVEMAATLERLLARARLLSPGKR